MITTSNRAEASARASRPPLKKGGLVQGDASEGYALLRLVGEELAQDLPGLFGSDGVAALVPVPAGTLRHAVEVLDQPGLASPRATC